MNSYPAYPSAASSRLLDLKPRVQRISGHLFEEYLSARVKNVIVGLFMVITKPLACLFTEIATV